MLSGGEVLLEEEYSPALEGMALRGTVFLVIGRLTDRETSRLDTPAQSGSYDRFGASQRSTSGSASLAGGVVLDLVAGDQVDGEVAGLGDGRSRAR